MIFIFTKDGSMVGKLNWLSSWFMITSFRFTIVSGLSSIFKSSSVLNNSAGITFVLSLVILKIILSQCWNVPSGGQRDKGGVAVVLKRQMLVNLS